ncbi:MAG TPA: ferrochelatase [Bdellovibrionales bacterium]|nr:ferrochelatase [Bdellovibrionales bacterium]
MKRGLLLLNLGTPDSPEPQDVGRYLKQFLMDKWVLDVPWLLRWILVNILIVPRRKYASAEAYKTIWSKRGSPLLFHLEDLKRKVSERVAGEFQVEIAMRYQNPSIESALAQFRDVDEVVVLPLYPQYAESSTRSSREELDRLAQKLRLKARIRFIQDFYDDPGFIRTFSQHKPKGHLLMSFHSLPEAHVQKTDASGEHCLKKAGCCDEITDVNRLCYRAQCFATARAIAKDLGLKKDEYSVSFQSKLGRAEWLKPSTESTLPELGRRGGDLTVMVPSFAADCLETIEEIGDRGHELFVNAGGKSFTRIDCPNASDEWADAVVALVRKHSDDI